MMTAFLLLLIVLSLGNAAVYWFGFRPLIGMLAQQKEAGVSLTQEPEGLSLVIAARNEESSLRQNLPHWLVQDWPGLEVLIIDDDSQDGSLEMLEAEAARHARLKVLEAGPKQRPGKKEALAKGIREAAHEWLLLSDADCRPASSRWASGMMQVREAQSAELVLGYSPYTYESGWLNAWIRFECLLTAVQYLSAALWGRTYMGVGRNMLYSRKLYDAAGGFDRHSQYVGGDDDLLVNAIASSTQTAIAVAPDTWVWTAPKQSLKAYRRQKTRHYAVSHAYRAKDQSLLALFSLSHVLHYIGLLVLVLTGHLTAALLMYAGRMLWVWLRLGSLCRQMGYPDLAWRVPFLDAGLALYYVAMSIPLLTSRFQKPSHWS